MYKRSTASSLERRGAFGVYVLVHGCSMVATLRKSRRGQRSSLGARFAFEVVFERREPTRDVRVHLFLGARTGNGRQDLGLCCWSAGAKRRGTYLCTS